jgi:hypothetical protein
MPDESFCAWTHPWIAAGTCPWCDAPVLRGRVVASLPASERGERRWDTAALLAALDHPDAQARRFVLWNCRKHGPGAEGALPLLRKAVAHPDPAVRSEATTALHLIGGAMTADEAERLEARLTGDPDDLAARGLLLGYYGRRQFDFEAERPARRRHALWVITNAPASDLAGNPLCEFHSCIDGDGYAEAKGLWLRHTAGSSDAAVLGNAASFFTISDVGLCEGLLRRCQELEPGEPYWPEMLAQLHSLHAQAAGTDEVVRQAGAKALTELERAWALTADEEDRFGLLKELAKSAFKAGEYPKARCHAEQMVAGAGRPEFARHAGAAIHHGNVVLGLLALREGDVEGAARHLVEAGKTPGSAPLRSFGPNMLLAKELLEAGQRDAVLEYLRLCSAFWQTADQRIDQWIYTVEQGGTPDFGGNLVY